jgi:flagellin-like protein
VQHKRKRGIRNKRAISTVVASILVLAITVALAVGLLTFGSSFMSSQEKIQPPTTDQIKIENVYFDSSKGTVQVTVRNIGTGVANVTDIYINGAQQKTFTPTFALIPSGQTAMFTVTPTIALVSNQAYTIKAATHNGGESTYTATYS